MNWVICWMNPKINKERFQIRLRPTKDDYDRLRSWSRVIALKFWADKERPQGARNNPSGWPEARLRLLRRAFLCVGCWRMYPSVPLPKQTGVQFLWSPLQTNVKFRLYHWIECGWYMLILVFTKPFLPQASRLTSKAPKCFLIRSSSVFRNLVAEAFVKSLPSHWSRHKIARQYMNFYCDLVTLMLHST